MKIRACRAAAVLFGGAVLVGCQSQPAPTLEVTQVAITEQTAQGMVVTFRVRADNRGDEALPLRTVRYSISLDGRPAFSGERNAESTVRRHGSQEFLLPVALTLGEGKDLPAVPSGQVSYSLSGSVEYEVPGSIAEVLFDTGIRRPSASFSESGRLDFSEIGPMGPDR
ncbi:MAG: LEA type 2 family protein [Phycisphaerae bacterium]|nr:LEA type 2 family protein [Phycisphaerae bacterium]